MALISIIENFQPKEEAALLERARQLTPALHYRTCVPSGLPQTPLGKGESVCLDFGEHMVGRVTLELSSYGSHPDAPAYLKLQFAEIMKEFSEDPQEYRGWLSRSWIQEELLHIDELPARVELPRRYAFRYLKITILDTSPKYKLRLSHVECLAQTSADRQCIRPLDSGDPLLDRIYDISLRTLADCMQEVFEDGPKRDRRLWMGDLRLQALTNSVSYRNFDLVKRCLYLFAGSRFPDGRISANIFTSPAPEADDTYLFDYALMFPVALEEYLCEVYNREALDDLYDIAMEQIEYALGQIGEDGRPSEQAVKDTFIDWNEDLDKSACTLAVLIYALSYAARLADRREDVPRAARLRSRRKQLQEAAVCCFWDEKEQCFVSGGQISVASQIWMVMADVPSPEQAAAAMRKALDNGESPGIHSPYLHHYYVMALLRAGDKEGALKHLKEYWGSMIDAGADTFFECWDPAKPDQSPYGGLLLNSFCHAWSCTPAYILKKYLLPESY